MESTQSTKERNNMIFDISIQAVLILVSIFMYLAMHNVPQKLLAKYREYRGRAGAEAKRQFVLGAQILAKARSPSNSHSTKISLAKQAEEAAARAISLDPKDAAAHILKALALDLQGYKSSALESIDVALSPLAVKSLSDRERGDALVKRAELLIGMRKKEKRVESAVEDLRLAVTLNKENATAFRLLGECYEAKEMIDEARSAYGEALKLNPDLDPVKDAVQRLGS